MSLNPFRTTIAIACTLGLFVLKLQEQFDWTGTIDDLNALVEATREVESLIQEDNPFRWIFLSIFTRASQSRFERTGSKDDLDVAVKARVEAVKLTPHDHPNRAV